MNTFRTLVFIGALLLFSAAPLVASDDANYSSGKRSEFYGTVEKLPEGLYGVWVVDGREIAVTPSTRIEQEHGRVAIGSKVEVKGTLEGLKFNAFEIEVKR